MLYICKHSRRLQCYIIPETSFPFYFLDGLALRWRISNLFVFLHYYMRVQKQIRCKYWLMMTGWRKNKKEVKLGGGGRRKWGKGKEKKERKMALNYIESIFHCIYRMYIFCVYQNEKGRSSVNVEILFSHKHSSQFYWL